MSVRRFVLIGICVLVALGSSGCSRIAKEFPSYTVHEDVIEDQIKAASDAYQLANKAKTRGDKMGLAKKGITYANRCATLAPERPECYFYQALNTGLYYEAKVLGYPRGMVRIAKAAEKVNDLDPFYERGGGYRILGMLYLKAPSFNIGSNEVHRDLDKSQSYLEMAVQIDPEYPENHLFLAENLIEQEDWPSAKNHIDTAVKLMKENQYPAIDIKYWKDLMRKMNKKLKKELPLSDFNSQTSEIRLPTSIS